MLPMIFLIMGAASCDTTNLKIPNSHWHTNLASGGARTKYINSQTTGLIDYETWEIQRIGYMCLSPEDVGDIITLVEILCSRDKIKCTKDMQEKINDLELFVKHSKDEQLR